jgi:methylenetetrahydrofolate reductase (NADPH)
MRYGPCGGVREDLGCEMTPSSACVFSGLSEPVPWGGPVATPLLAPLPAPPVVLTDFTVQPYSAADVASVAGVLAGSCDAVLVGEHQNRPDFPPSLMTRLVLEAGATPWITLTCRDRNRFVLEQELMGLLVAGAGGVLCVTGDGRGRDVRPGVTQVFDLDSTELASLAVGAGLPLVAVAESPSSPPESVRPGRVYQKQLAGAQVCVLNHVGSVSRVSAFAASASAAGVTIPLIASVAVYTDERSAAVLRLPGLHLDEAKLEAVLGSPDPVAAGIAAAVDEARALLAIPGVAGVNLSGLASGQGEVFAAQVKAEIGRRVRS